MRKVLLLLTACGFGIGLSGMGCLIRAEPRHTPSVIEDAGFENLKHEAGDLYRVSGDIAMRVRYGCGNTVLSIEVAPLCVLDESAGCPDDQLPALTETECQSLLTKIQAIANPGELLASAKVGVVSNSRSTNWHVYSRAVISRVSEADSVESSEERVIRLKILFSQPVSGEIEDHGPENTHHPELLHRIMIEGRWYLVLCSESDCEGFQTGSTYTGDAIGPLETTVDLRQLEQRKDGPPN